MSEKAPQQQQQQSQPAVVGTSAPPTAPASPARTKILAKAPFSGTDPPPVTPTGRPRVCIIGSGHIGKRVAQILATAFPSVRVVGILDVKAATASPMPRPREHVTPPPVVAAAPILTALPSELDGVWICSPPESRAAHVRECAQLGARCIYVEPPIAPTLAEVKQCYEACRLKDAELLCGWPHRFDPECAALYSSTRERHIASIHLKHHVYPSSRPRPATPSLPVSQPSSSSMSSLPSSPLLGAQLELSDVETIFQRLMAEDFNAAAYFMDEQFPVSAQATCRDTYGSGCADTAVAHLEYAGGKSVLIEASLVGALRYESSVSMVLAGGVSETAGKKGTWLCRADRFDAALHAQAEYFTKILRGESVQRVCSQQHCKLTARMVEMAIESAATGRKLMANPSMRLLQIGCGAFGTLVQQRVLPRLPAGETVGVITASSSELELDSMLARKDVDCVYVCTPYAHTSALVKRALGYKKKVLGEVPLPKFRDIQQIAIAGDRFLMLAYHRRFDAEYRKAKSFIEDLGAISSLVVESRDTVPSSTDAIDTLYKSVVHDLDTVSWLLEDVDCELSLKSIKIHGPASSISVVVNVWLKKYDKTVDAHVLYSRGSPVYRQHVTVNGKTFGYEAKAAPENFLETFCDAYARMFQFFANVCPTPGQGRACVTYGQAHELLMAAIEKATDEHELKVAPKHDVQAHRGIADTDAAPKGSQPRHMPSFEEFHFAVASHGGLFASGSRLFKPTLYEGHEWTVYQAIRERESQLQPFVPEVFDQVVINDVPYLVMRNLVHGYTKPRVLNVKVCLSFPPKLPLSL